MPPRKRTEGTTTSKDDLVKDIVAGMKKEGVPTYILGQEESPTDLDDFVSSGSSLFDLAVSNRPNGGITAFGRILELSGLEGSGKSLIAAHMMANVQKEGGIAVLFDTETAVSAEFFKAVGVDLDALVYSHTNVLEDIFEQIEKMIEKVRKSDKKRKVIIVVDSIAACSTRAEMESGYEKQGYGTGKAEFLSRACRKITGLIGTQKIALVLTNQLRQKLNAQPFADPYTTPGGLAVRFTMSSRVRLSQKAQIKNAEKEVIGVTVQAKVIKNRYGPNNRTAEFDIYYDRGIDDVSSWMRFMADNDLISGNGNPYYFVDSDGVEHEFKKSTWKEFIEKNPETYAQMYEKIAEKMVRVYNSANVSTLDGSALVERVGDDVNNYHTDEHD